MNMFLATETVTGLDNLEKIIYLISSTSFGTVCGWTMLGIAL